jgi:hypothetical protein
MNVGTMVAEYTVVEERCAETETSAYSGASLLSWSVAELDG